MNQRSDIQKKLSLSTLTERGISMSFVWALYPILNFHTRHGREVFHVVCDNDEVVMTGSAVGCTYISRINLAASSIFCIATSLPLIFQIS